MSTRPHLYKHFFKQSFFTAIKFRDILLLFKKYWLEKILFIATWLIWLIQELNSFCRVFHVPSVHRNKKILTNLFCILSTQSCEMRYRQVLAVSDTLATPVLFSMLTLATSVLFSMFTVATSVSFSMLTLATPISFSMLTIATPVAFSMFTLVTPISFSMLRKGCEIWQP